MFKKSKSIVELASEQVKDFETLHHTMLRYFIIVGKTKSTFNNYTRCLAHISFRSTEFPNFMENVVTNSSF